jgi:hypothetical protein
MLIRELGDERSYLLLVACLAQMRYAGSGVTGPCVVGEDQGTRFF